VGLECGGRLRINGLAGGAEPVRRFQRSHARLLRAAAEIANRARSPHREVSLALLQPQYASDRRGPGIVLSGTGAARTGPRQTMAQPGAANTARSGPETGPARRRLFRAIILLPPLHDGFLYASLRADAGQRRHD